MDGVKMEFQGADAADRMMLDRMAWTNRLRDLSESVRLAEHAQSISANMMCPDARRIAGLAHYTLTWKGRWSGQVGVAARHEHEAPELLRGTGCGPSTTDAGEKIGDIEGALAVYRKFAELSDTAPA